MRRRPTIDDIVARMKASLPVEFHPYVDVWIKKSRRRITETINRRMKSGEVRVVDYLDYFKLNDAPFDWEERTSASGLSTYTVKVYRPEAYTNEYMHVSDESGRLVRWGVRLDDGRIVSRDGLIRLRFPERWEEIRKILAKQRGVKREEAAAQFIWRGLTESEKAAMIRSVDLSAFDEMSTFDAEKAIRRSLFDNGSILAHVDDVPWFDMVRDHKAESLTGRPYGSADVSLHDYVNFRFADAGEPERFQSDEEVAKAFQESDLIVRLPHRQSVAPIVTAVGSYAFFPSQHAERAAGIKLMRPLVLARVGGPWSRVDEEKVAEYDPNVRRGQIQAIDKRVSRMQPRDRIIPGVSWVSWMSSLLQHLHGYSV